MKIDKSVIVSEHVHLLVVTSFRVKIFESKQRETEAGTNRVWENDEGKKRFWEFESAKRVFGPPRVTKYSFSFTDQVTWLWHFLWWNI